MSPAVNISAELSPGEIYARLAWIKGLTVELLAGNVVVRGASPGEHTRRIWRLTTALMAPAIAMDASSLTFVPICGTGSGERAR